ncbi:MAG: nicotinate-nucleotide--dimethylbenzimidazole phosphoribosyltransferase [Lysobacterales bacterium]
MNWRAAAAAAMARKTMPTGALGRLQALAIDLAARQRTLSPRVERTRVIVYAADHGVSLDGVSAYPRAVTAQMLRNFAEGGAAVCVLARTLGVELEVVDVGVDRDPEPLPGVAQASVMRGSHNLRVQAAMSPAQCAAALAVGRAALRRADGVDALGLGEMGIGNTTAASALLAALTGASPADCVGPGTGLAGAALAHKQAVVAQALARLRPGSDAMTVLAELGGLEIAALVGCILEAAQTGIAVVVDGFIVTVAALVATRIDPACAESLIYAHRSAEPAHQLALEALGAEPLLDLGMRLGEGTGAVLAMPLLRAAAAILREMATFESAAVADRAPC